jgi:hypothetical protein
MSNSKYCPDCGVAVTEPSVFCSSCGAALDEPKQAPHAAAGAPAAPGPAAQAGPQAVAGAQSSAAQGPPAPGVGSPSGAPTEAASRAWIPFAVIGGAIVGVAGLVVILLLALGGSAGNNVKSAAATRAQALQLLAANGTTTVSPAAPGLFAVVQAGRLNVVVPAGWRATAQAASSATRAEFADPKQPTSNLTIVDEKGAGGNNRGRALAARKSVSHKGYLENHFGRITFPGGRAAWQLTYTGAGATHATYFYSACNGSDAMVVDVSTTSQAFQKEQTRLGVAAASAEPLC